MRPTCLGSTPYLGGGPAAAMQCVRPAAGAICGAGAACFGAGGAAPGYAGPRGAVRGDTRPAAPPHVVFPLPLAAQCPMPPFPGASPFPAGATSGPPWQGGSAAATWLELGKNPVSALHDFCQARQRLAPLEQRASWQP